MGSDTRDRSQVRNYSMDCYSSRTLSEDLMIRTKDDRCNLSSLINSIQISARIVTNQLRNPGLSVKTDVENCINKIWLENLVKSRSLKYIITSKTKAVIEVDAEYCGDLSIAFTPLIGDTSSPYVFSSIFCIFKSSQQSSKFNHQDRYDDQSQTEPILKSGKEVMAAGYLIYGVVTSLVLASKGGALLYQLNDRVGEFELVKCLDLTEKTPITKKTSVKSTEIKTTSTQNNNDNCVLDCNTVLLQGGVYSGEEDFYCAALPISFIMEQAGGSSVLTEAGKFVKITEMTLSDLHEKVKFSAGQTCHVMNRVTSSKHNV